MSEAADITTASHHRSTALGRSRMNPSSRSDAPHRRATAEGAVVLDSALRSVRQQAVRPG